MWNKVADADVFNDSGERFWIINQMVPLFSEPRGGMGQMFREIIRSGSVCYWLCSSWASWDCMLTHSARILIWHGAATIVAVPNPLDFYRAHLCSLFLSWHSCFSGFLLSGWGIDSVAASFDVSAKLQTMYSWSVVTNNGSSLEDTHFREVNIRHFNTVRYSCNVQISVKHNNKEDSKDCCSFQTSKGLRSIIKVWLKQYSVTQVKSSEVAVALCGYC